MIIEIQSVFESAECAIRCIGDSVLTVHYAEKTLLLVVCLKRLCLLVIDLESVCNCIGVVILALDQGAAALVANAFHSRLLGNQVIGAAASFADTATGQSGGDDVVCDIDVENSVDRNAHAVECLGLSDGSREAVKDKAVLAVVLGDALLDDVDDDFIGNQLAAFDERLGFETDLRAAFQRFSDNIARRNLRDVKSFGGFLCLSALAGAGSAQKYNLNG